MVTASFSAFRVVVVKSDGFEIIIIVAMMIMITTDTSS